MHRIVGWIDLVLFVALIAFGLWVVAYRPWGFDPAAAASLAGALFGRAALLLGNWINRSNDRHKADSELVQRVEKLKALIAAELVDVGSGLMSQATHGCSHRQYRGPRPRGAGARHEPVPATPNVLHRQSWC